MEYLSETQKTRSNNEDNFLCNFIKAMRNAEVREKKL